MDCFIKNICEKCNDTCDTIRYQQNFKNWTSGNNDIDKFIQDTQLLAHSTSYHAPDALEWISYDRFHNIKYIAKGKFGEVYKANWFDGNISYWNKKNQNWRRNN